jgi:4-amino-4-deoxy-L-arabinose transferase-like glycosyltransferase
MAASLRDPWLLALITVNLVVKFPLLWLNEAEYTDGLIQLGLFENGCPLYMPLFTLLAGCVASLGVEPILAGRVVSLAANTLTLIPIHLTAVWLTGSRGAGRWAAALYLVSPIPTRWGLRVMTDSLFTLLWWVSLTAFLAAAPRLGRNPEDSGPCPFRMIALASVFGALAALTRQTGWLLLPPVCLGLLLLARRSPWHALRPAVTLLVWGLPLMWMALAGSVEGHGGQVAERFTWLASLVLVESYALDWPLIVGWPLAVLTVWGIFRPIGSGLRWGWFVGALVFGTAGILALQCLIQSYLFRYLLPLVGFCCVLGGGVLARLGRDHPRALLPVALVTLGWLTGATFDAPRRPWGPLQGPTPRASATRPTPAGPRAERRRPPGGAGGR